MKAWHRYIRLAFVSKKAALAGVTLDDATISLMATQLPDNLRVIEGALLKLTASSHLLEKNIDLPFAKQVLKDQLLDDKNTRSTHTSNAVLNRTLLIGVGGAGINMAKGMLDHSFSCDRNLYVGSSEWVQELPDSERLYFDYEHDDEPHSVSEVRDMLRRPQRAFIREKFEAMDAVILTNKVRS